MQVYTKRTRDAKGLLLMTLAFSCSLFLLMDFFVFPLQADSQSEDQYKGEKKSCSYFRGELNSVTSSSVRTGQQTEKYIKGWTLTLICPQREQYK